MKLEGRDLLSARGRCAGPTNRGERIGVDIGMWRHLLSPLCGLVSNNAELAVVVSGIEHTYGDVRVRKTVGSCVVGSANGAEVPPRLPAIQSHAHDDVGVCGDHDGGDEKI